MGVLGDEFSPDGPVSSIITQPSKVLLGNFLTAAFGRTAGLRDQVAQDWADFASVGGRKVNIKHLNGGKLFQYAARGLAAGTSFQLNFERDLKAVGHE
jgi:hypothetical protein